MSKKLLLAVLGLIVIVLIVFRADLLSVVNPGRRARILVSEAQSRLITYPFIGPRTGEFFWYRSTPENDLIRVRQITVFGWKITAQNLIAEDNSKIDNKIHEFLISQGFRPDPYNATAAITISADGYLKNNLACLKTSRLTENAKAAEKQLFAIELICGLLPAD